MIRRFHQQHPLRRDYYCFSTAPGENHSVSTTS